MMRTDNLAYLEVMSKESVGTCILSSIACLLNCPVAMQGTSWPAPQTHMRSGASRSSSSIRFEGEQG